MTHSYLGDTHSKKLYSARCATYNHTYCTGVRLYHKEKCECPCHGDEK